MNDEQAMCEPEEQIPMTNVVRVKPRPFIKAVGGKTKLLSELRKVLPKQFGWYFEPFVGGGALFWDLEPKDAWINDTNAEFMNVYCVIRERLEQLIRELTQSERIRGGYVYDEKQFYAIRSLPLHELSMVERAARTIYLNKTCFNGLYRVNKKGEFNVPFGRYENPTIFDPENLRACSRALAGVMLSSKDFESIMTAPKPGSLVYFDSPYVPVSKTANFVSYTKDGFGLEDHKRLARVFREFAARGVYCVLSNSDTPLARELYAGFPMVEVSRSGAINSKATARGRVGELIITSGNW